MRIDRAAMLLFTRLVLGFVLSTACLVSAPDQSFSHEQRKHLAEEANRLDRQFQDYYRKGDYRQARAAEQHALDLARRLLGEQHKQMARYYNNLGNVSDDLGDYNAARKYHERALAIKLKVFGEEHASTATSYNNLGVVSRHLGDYPAARKYHERALAIRCKILGEDHADTAASYDNLGVVLETLGDYNAAKKCHERALAIYRKVVGEEHADTAMSYNNLGVVSEAAGDYPAARKYYERALAIKLKLLGEEHADTAMSYNNLGNVSRAVGDYPAARQYHERALAIRRKVLGEEHADTAMSFGNLGNVCEDLGDYPAARKYYERALAIRRKVLGEDHDSTGMSYNNLGVLSQDLGDYAAARKYDERALAIRRKVLGEEHADTAMSYNNLGVLSQDLGDYAAARKYYERALGIRRKVLGEEHIDTAGSYNNLGMVSEALGNYPVAYEYYERALAIKLKVLGEAHADTAASYNNLGNGARALREYAAARKYYERALAIFRRVLGEAHADTAVSYNNLMVLEAEVGDWPAAAGWTDKERRGVRRAVAKLLPSLNEREHRQFLQSKDWKHLELSLSLAILRPQDPALRSRSAGWLLNAKGVGQQALAERSLLSRDARDPKLAPVVRQLTDVRRRLAQLSLAAARPGQVEERQKQLAELSAEESELSRQLVEAGGTTLVGDPWVEVNAVRSALPSGSVLVEMARFRIYPLSEKDKTKQRFGSARYVAWVIPAAGTRDVQLVDLGEAEAIDSQVKTLREKFRAVQGKDSTLLKEGEPKAEAELRELFQQLADRIWKPLAPHVADAKQLFLSPDGALWLVPWGAIPVEKGKFLIEKFSINYLISGRDVVSLSRGTVSEPTRPVVFADPNFDLPPDEVTSAVQAVFRSAFKDEGEGKRSSDKSLLPRVGRLAGTAQEAAAIKPSVEKLAGQAPVLYQDIYALESVAKKLKRPKVAVFSTHGFFLPDQEPKSDDRDSRLGLAGYEHRGVTLTTAGKPFENPLLRCGLLFAGCNPRNEGQAGSGDDGVLTGMEIVGIDFRGTELVVLSACETGVGTVNNGEGVAGLRQAFQLAGAQAVVATLWQIPDVDSARLMNDFFANLAAGQSKGEALRNAQLKRIEARRVRYGAAHPFFWAAYTITGK